MAENTPNAGKLMESLRFLGYNNYSAICDIVDNSFDAEASNVWIEIKQKSSETVIEIADDGSGMHLPTLDQALRLGSITDRNEASDLGKYGMGLVTASLSIARNTRVLTRANGKLLKSVVDLDEMISTNSFEKILCEADTQDSKLFAAFIAAKSTGTLVVLTKCDNIKNSNLTIFRNILRLKLAQTYRYYLQSGKKIYLNGDLVELRDPLMLDEGSEIFSDETFEVSFERLDGKLVSDTMRVRVALLPDFGSDGNKERKINMHSQGFYVLRNNREIAEGASLKLFVRHNDLNRFRAEIFFSGVLDEPMGVNFTKQDVDPSQAVRDKLNAIISGQLRTIRNRLKSARVAVEDSEITHEESEKVISAKSHLLLKPKPPKNGSASESTRGVSREEVSGKDKTPKGLPSPGQAQRAPYNVRFEAASFGKAGPIFSAEQIGKTTVIQWNIDHPFYERFILERKDDKTLRTSVDFLIYSIATAELMATNEDTYAVIENIRAVMSSNLRSLLS